MGGKSGEFALLFHFSRCVRSGAGRLEMRGRARLAILGQRDDDKDKARDMADNVDMS